MPANSRVHLYRATSSWVGSTAVGYDHYDRTHSVTADPSRSPLTLSADPAFQGNASLLNPEQLLLMAASSCQLLSFLALAARSRIDVLRYDDDAEAEMPENATPVRITRIVLRPRVLVARGTPEERVLKLLHKAHDQCYIANSLKSEISLEAVIEFR
ncbi:MAG TPA: OsmC family protein [Thermoanaerobaculia bacterium]|nr:OsmC family protein [Thermoanaerobaculia bacterium]